MAINKKGFVDGVFFIVILVVVVISAVLAGYIFTEFRNSSGLENDPVYGNETTRIFIPFQNLFNAWDTLLVLLAIGLGIALIVSVFILPTGPIFKVAAVIMILIIVLLAGSLANVFESIHDDTHSDISNYSRTNFGTMDSLISDNYPKFVLVFMVLSFILLLGKRQFGSETV